LCASTAVSVRARCLQIRVTQRRHIMSNSPTANQLAERIAAFNADLVKQAPDGVKAVMAEIENLVRSGAGKDALKIGDTAPDFTLPDARHRAISLATLRQSGPVVVTFYRGQWCPYCDLQLRAYQEILPRVRALGATLAAISPQTPDETLSTAEKRNLEFHVLSDSGNMVARRWGLVWKVNATLDSLHKAFGVDLAKSNGETSNELPVPATFVVERSGRIAFAHFDPNWGARLEPAALISALEKVARK
jgi:peroxiredoxin